MVSVLASSAGQTKTIKFSFVAPTLSTRGGSGGRRAHPARAPLKLEKNKIFWRKFVIFHTKYLNNFRASLRSAQFF
jgi:hypothetical protein